MLKTERAPKSVAKPTAKTVNPKGEAPPLAASVQNAVKKGQLKSSEPEPVKRKWKQKFDCVGIPLSIPKAVLKELDGEARKKFGNRSRTAVDLILIGLQVVRQQGAGNRVSEGVPARKRKVSKLAAAR